MFESMPHTLMPIFPSLQTVYDPMYISVYNLFYTSLPVLALGVFEQDVSDQDSITYPKLYSPGLNSEFFNTREFLRSVLHGLFSSMVTFIVPWGTYRDGIAVDGLVLSDHMTLASVMAAILIFDNTAQVRTRGFPPISGHLLTHPSHFAGHLDCSRYDILDDRQSRDHLGQCHRLFRHRLRVQLLFGWSVRGRAHHRHERRQFLGHVTGLRGHFAVANANHPILCIRRESKSGRSYPHEVSHEIGQGRRRQGANQLGQTTAPIDPFRIRVFTSRKCAPLRCRSESDRRARYLITFVCCCGFAVDLQEGFGRLITSGKIMRKLPQDLSFPLGLGSKRQQQPNGDGPLPNSVDNHTASSKDELEAKPANLNERRRSSQDLDTINL